MQSDRELMQQALDALDGYARNCRCEGGGAPCDAAEALRARLEKWTVKDMAYRPGGLPQEEQELVAWARVNMNDHKEGDLGIGTVKWDASAPLVVHPHPAFQATQPQQHSEQWWKHEVSNAWAEGYEKGRASVKHPEQEPVAWIKERELLYMQAVAAHGKTDWKTNLGLKPEDGDVPLYTAPPQREWQGLTDEQVKQIEMSASSTLSAIYITEAQLKGKNAL